MKKIALLLTLVLSITEFYAQNTSLDVSKDFIKERKEIAKLTEKALNAKVSKIAKKEAKKMKKEGWIPGPGRLPLQNQLDETYRKQVELNGKDLKYMFGNGQNTGGNYTAAKRAAEAFARQNLAEQMGNEMGDLIETKVLNKEIDKEDGESLTKFFEANTAKFQRKIGKYSIVMEAVRDINGKKEVMIVIAYEMKEVKRICMEEMEEEMDEEMKDVLHDIMEQE